MTELTRVTADDLKSLALGAGILGTGGGTHPYLELLNIEKLYRDGHQVSLLSPDALADDDLVAEVGFMGAPLVTKERLPDPEQVLKAYRMMQRHAGCSFRALSALSLVQHTLARRISQPLHLISVAPEISASPRLRVPCLHAEDGARRR